MIFYLCLFLSSLGSLAALDRYTLNREESSSPIVYYFSTPQVDEYPILIICEGSSAPGQLESVLRLPRFLARQLEPFNMGYLAVEKWGIDGTKINENEFWAHYTRSQRLEDHIKVIESLKRSPPDGWNGKLIFLGGSEGGPLVTDLSILYPDNLATINLVGAGDYSWIDEFWIFFEKWKQDYWLYWFYDMLPRWVPYSSDIPYTREEYDALVQEIIENPTPYKRMGGMTHLYNADAFQAPQVEYSKIKSPFLVVMGSLDPNIESCDLFVEKALDAGAAVTYIRVEGMDHFIGNREDIMEQVFNWLHEQLL